MQILIKNIQSIEGCLGQRPEYIEDKRWQDIQNLKQEADKKRSMVSGYLQDYMCKNLGIKKPSYGYTQKGKPYLDGVEDVSFNISHSGDYAVLAFHKCAEAIGIDIQQIRRLHDGAQRRILHEKEKLSEAGLQEDRTRYLNRIWSVKESFVKMTGEGLSRDFRTLYVDFEKGIIVSDSGETAAFTVCEWKKDYFLAVCTKSREDVQLKEI